MHAAPVGTQPPSSCDVATSSAAAESTRFSRRAAAGADVVDDLDLIVSELMANSIQHGDGGDIVVRVDAPSAKWFSITVTNGVASSLPPMDPTTWKVAATDLPSGRGLGIVRRLADEIAVTEAAGLVHVTCRRRR